LCTLLAAFPGFSRRRTQRAMLRVKLSLCLTKHYATKTYGGVDVYIHVFLTSALVGDGPLYRRYPLPSGLSGPLNRSERRGEEKNLAPNGTRIPTPRPSSSIASRYTGSYYISYAVIKHHNFDFRLSTSPSNKVPCHIMFSFVSWGVARPNPLSMPSVPVTSS
jgi:hypothetical protein